MDLIEAPLLRIILLAWTKGLLKALFSGISKHLNLVFDMTLWYEFTQLIRDYTYSHKMRAT